MAGEIDIYVFENDDSIEEIYHLICEVLGWRLVAVANTMLEAGGIIQQLGPHTHAIAFVDGNLDGFHGSRDGKQIAAQLQTRCPRVTTVGVSGDTKIAGAHFNLLNTDLDSLLDAAVHTPILNHHYNLGR